MRLTEAAPAKINLFLHVGATGADGYHPLASLMVFADLADEVAFEEAEAPELLIGGPFGEGLDAGPGNLVARARDAFLAATDAPDARFRLTLTKTLPIAAGLGGGSSDAAATLRLLSGITRARLSPATWESLALALGADVPACLTGQAVLAEGRGERLSAPPLFCDLDAVLVNPGVASSTAEVFRNFDTIGAPGDAEMPEMPPEMDTLDAMISVLEPLRNDLEAPAIALNPAIGEVLATLGAYDEVKLARMSGSGSTCFGLVPGPVEAAWVAWRLKTDNPDWWVRTCRLKGSYP